MMARACRLFVQTRRRYVTINLIIKNSINWRFYQGGNVFDNLPSLAPPKSTELRDKLARYLSTDPENVKDVLIWWHERKAMYPRLSRMALDYLTIPGTQFIIHYLFIKLTVSFIFLSHIHRCRARL
jgi:hypothetical protein